MTDFTDEMDKLAAGIAKSANADEKAFGDQIDAFKALMPYYALITKGKKGDESDDDDSPDFNTFNRNIHAVK